MEEQAIVQNIRNLITTLPSDEKLKIINNLGQKEQMDLIYGFDKTGPIDNHVINNFIEKLEEQLEEQQLEEPQEDQLEEPNKLEQDKLEPNTLEQSKVVALPSMKVPKLEQKEEVQLGKKELKRLKRKEEKNASKGITRGYSESDRQKIVTEFYVSVGNLNIMHIVTDQIKTILDDYVKTGKEYDLAIPIPEYQRTLIMKLYNTRNEKTYINFQQEKTVTEYGAKVGNYTSGPVGQFRRTVDQLKKQGIDYSI